MLLGDVILKIVIPHEVRVALTTLDWAGPMGGSGLMLKVILGIGLVSTS